MPTDKEVAVFLLVSGEKLRDQLMNILQEHHYHPVAMPGPDDLVQALKEYQYATVFLDCEAVSFYGRGIYSKIKVACKSSRVVLLCDKSHLKHRDIIKEAMEIGVYACLLAPFEGWEILAMVRHSQAKKPTKKRIKKRLSS